MKKKYFSLLLLLILISGCKNNDVKQQTTNNNMEKIIIFEDKNLENLIRTEINKPDGDITSFDMLELKSLRTKDTAITDLSGLEYAENLYDISIFKNEIISLDPISKISSLKRINVSYSVIKNQPIKFDKKVQLVDVSFIDTPLVDISFVKEMISVENFSATSCGLKNIDAISKLKNLIDFDINDNKVDNIKALRGKSKLEYIDIQDNNVSDISSLEGLSSLIELDLSYNPVTNLKALENLSNLQTLTIYQHHDVKHLIFDQVDKLINKGVEVLYHR